MISTYLLTEKVFQEAKEEIGNEPDQRLPHDRLRVPLPPGDNECYYGLENCVVSMRRQMSTWRS